MALAIVLIKQLEINKSKPIILIHFESVHNYYFINIAAPGKENGSKSLKHVNLMNLTAIKRVVDITEASTDGIFALVCRTNQELKVCLFVFRLCAAWGSLTS